MTTLFTNARLIDPEAQTETLGALLVKDGKITEIFDNPVPDISLTVIRQDADGKYLAPGIVDVGVKVSEPGERHKESFRSAGRAAAAGGVTTMVTRPDTLPAIDTPEVLEFVTRRANQDAPVHVRPLSALTRGRLGREMVEIGFMLDAGAIAFSDCDNVVTDNKVLSRCMTYARSLGALVIGHPQ
ncbi:MAG: dihydroorotase, partial [Paracoccaceae bacterium]